MFYRCGFVLVSLGLLAPAVHGQASLPVATQGQDTAAVRAEWSVGDRLLLKAEEDESPANVRNFTFDPLTPDRLLATTSSPSRLWETVDGGLTWQWFDLPGDATMPAFAPSDPSIIYATGGMWGVWKSEDGGGSWKLLASEPFESSFLWGLAVSPEDPNIVVVASSGIVSPGPGGMYLTTDGGQTWSNRATGFEYWSNTVVFSRSHPEIAFATQENGTYPLFWSNGSGYEWKQIPGIYPTYTFLHISPGDPDLLYFGSRSTSRGIYRGPVTTQKWEQVHLGDYYPKDGVFLRHVATDPETPGRIAVALTSGIILSEDDGASWTQISPRVAQQIAFDPHHPNRLWMAGGIGADYGIEALDLGSIDTEGGPGVSELTVAIYPNPAGDHVTISYQAPAGEPVTARVYDLLGREVALLLDARPASGAQEQVVLHSLTHRLPAGAYLVTLTTSASRHARQVTILGR